MIKKSFIISAVFILSQLAYGNVRVSVYDMMDGARSHMSKNQTKEAIEAYDSVLNYPKIRKSVLFEAFASRARCHKLMANYTASLSDYDSALNIEASQLNHTVVALNKSDLLLQTGSYNKAEELLRSLPDLNNHIKNRRISNLATVCVRTGRYKEAEDLYLSIVGDSLEGGSKAVTFQNLGFLYMEQGEWQKAIERFKAACPLFPDNTVARFISLSNLAFAEAFYENYDSALEHIDTSLEGLTALLGSSHPDVINVKRKKAEILMKSGYKDKATAVFKDYFLLNKRNVMSVFSGMGTQARLDFWKKEHPHLSLIFGIGDEDPSFLFDVSLFRRSIALSGSKCNTDKTLGITGKDIRRILKPKDAVVDFVVFPERDDNGKLVDHIGAIVADKLHVNFVSLGRLTDIEEYRVNGLSLKDAVTSGIPEYINTIYSDSLLTELIWKPVLEKVKLCDNLYFVPDGILNLLAVEYLKGMPPNLKLHRLTTLANLVNASNFRKRPSEGSFMAAGGLNYDELPEVSSRATKGDNGFDSKAVPNHLASDFLKEHIPYFSFTTLPGMKSEVDLISKIDPAFEIKTTLSEEDFKANAWKYPIIHVSTHGYAIHDDSVKPQYLLSDSITADNSLIASGLVLSGANIASRYNDREDGLLSAREICDLDLRNVGLVVLSACQTADGKISDEGPAGLLRGLKNAGASTVIATLWEVDDTATKQFMTEFYKLLSQGFRRSDAFAKARNNLISYRLEEPEVIFEYDPAIQASRMVETGKTISSYPMASPYMWAPFIIIDNLEN